MTSLKLESFADCPFCFPKAMGESIRGCAERLAATVGRVGGKTALLTGGGGDGMLQVDARQVLAEMEPLIAEATAAAKNASGPATLQR